MMIIHQMAELARIQFYNLAETILIVRNRRVINNRFFARVKIREVL